MSSGVSGRQKKKKKNGVEEKDWEKQVLGRREELSRCPPGCHPGGTPESPEALGHILTWAGSKQVCRTGQDRSVKDVGGREPAGRPAVSEAPGAREGRQESQRKAMICTRAAWGLPGDRMKS